MDPTIAEGDGFVVIPSTGLGSAEVGDVVIYDAQEANEGGLTTHRVVGATDHGYETAGDANIVTDQDGGEPAVTDGQIVAKAWTVGGDVVTIPHLGTVVMNIQSGIDSIRDVLGIGPRLGSQGIATLLFGVGVALLAFTFLTKSRSRHRERTRSRRTSVSARGIVFGLVVCLCIVTFGTMLAISGSTEFGTVSADYESDAPHVIQSGETGERNYERHNGGLLPVVSILEPASQGVSVEDEPTQLHHGESANTTITVTAPTERGYVLHAVSEFRYLAVLPPPLLEMLHDVHPWIAMTSVTAVVVSLFTLPFALLLGTGRIVLRERKSGGHTHDYLRI
ncbi:S26 family signal peptidase [Natrarchaeobius halalkaliphilus]|nr:S26 family signal peptidase [Natrarchaeobius halalkaliphilus]